MNFSYESTRGLAQYLIDGVFQKIHHALFLKVLKETLNADKDVEKVNNFAEYIKIFSAEEYDPSSIASIVVLEDLLQCSHNGLDTVHSWDFKRMGKQAKYCCIYEISDHIKNIQE